MVDTLGQLITKYPQLKKCSVEMLECLDFTRIDDNFDFSKSDWAKSILGTVYMEIEGIESSMKKSLEELYGIEELETYFLEIKPKFNIINFM